MPQETNASRFVLGDDPVLVVEDDEVFADTLEDMLTEIGCRDVSRASTVEEALRQIEAASPRIVVLDASLRGIAAHRVAARLLDQGIPFVVSTGYDPRTLPQPFGHGIPLKKPYSRDALAAALAAAVARRAGDAR